MVDYGGRCIWRRPPFSEYTMKGLSCEKDAIDKMGSACAHVRGGFACCGLYCGRLG